MFLLKICLLQDEHALVENALRIEKDRWMTCVLITRGRSHDFDNQLLLSNLIRCYFDFTKLHLLNAE